MESMQASFEAEARAKVEALKSKKKLEQDIVELESALDNANRGRAEADKVIKKLQQQVKDIEGVRVLHLYTLSVGFFWLCVLCNGEVGNSIMVKNWSLPFYISNDNVTLIECFYKLNSFFLHKYKIFVSNGQWLSRWSH